MPADAGSPACPFRRFPVPGPAVEKGQPGGHTLRAGRAGHPVRGKEATTQRCDIQPGYAEQVFPQVLYAQANGKGHPQAVGQLAA